MAILAGYRGQGIGSQLLAELLAVVDKSYSRTSLSVQAANPAQHIESDLKARHLDLPEDEGKQRQVCDGEQSIRSIHPKKKRHSP